jgi:sodium transport system ATP-binding protein
VGPNGAGKSTSLRMLYTVVRPDSGDAFIDGKSVMKSPRAAAAQLGVLPHSVGIYPNLTGRENILYYGALHGLTRTAARERTAELITLLEMQEWADRLARGYSHGQRLKTALGRALVHRPRNVVLDEPTNGLDVMAVRALRALLRQLREEGHCVLFSSHVMQEVNELCDEVAVIAGGMLLAAGTPAAICAQTNTATLEEAFVKLILSV